LHTLWISLLEGEGYYSYSSRVRGILMPTFKIPPQCWREDVKSPMGPYWGHLICTNIPFRKWEGSYAYSSRAVWEILCLLVRYLLVLKGGCYIGNGSLLRAPYYIYEYIPSFTKGEGSDAYSSRAAGGILCLYVRYLPSLERRMLNRQWVLIEGT
jgi:hypothetical protein